MLIANIQKVIFLCIIKNDKEKNLKLPFITHKTIKDQSKKKCVRTSKKKIIK